MRFSKGAFFACALLALAGMARAQVVETSTLTLDGARKAIAAGLDYAARNHAPGGVIAVVDSGGNLMALERLDGTFAAGANVSIGKARTAALFKKPTKVFEDIVNKGRTTMVALNDFTPLQGGVPIVVDGNVVGAVGVSGAASAQQDEEIAMAAAGAVNNGKSLQLSSIPITHFPAAEVSAAFAKGVPLLETSGYKIHASMRTSPGEVEVHDYETDVFYIVKGRATLMLGGKPVGGRVTAPGEFRAPALEGGDAHVVGQGDVIVIPKGVPHWFKEVEGTVHYFTVKPISRVGGDT